MTTNKRQRYHGRDKPKASVPPAQQSMQQVPVIKNQVSAHSKPQEKAADKPIIVPVQVPRPLATPRQKPSPPPAKPKAVEEWPTPEETAFVPATTPPPIARPPAQRTPTPHGELTDMLDSLRALFVLDRTRGARGDATRCGICYLTFPLDEVEYREADGFYACRACAKLLGNQTLPMLRRQRK